MKKELSTEESRQGKTLNQMRYVLTISIALVVVGFAIIYAYYYV